MNKLRMLRGEELRQRAEELGVSLVPGTDASGNLELLEPALQSRVMAAEAWLDSHRASRRSTFANVLAIISLLLSILSAVQPFFWA